MAHVKVVRRSMRPEEYTDLRFGWLKRHIYGEMSEIDNIRIRDAHQISEMKFEYYSEDFRPLKKNDIYFTPDGNAFIEFDAVIPDKLKNKPVYFYLKTAAEMIVKINGSFAGGIDPNRERICLDNYKNDKILHFEIMGYNRSKPDDERNPETLKIRGCRQIFNGAYFTNINEEVQSLCYDLELLLDISKSESFNEDFRHLINTQLNFALNLIDFDNVETDDVKLAAEYIERNIYNNSAYRGNGKVALVSHSHLDIAYYWRRIHAVQKNLRTVLIQLRLMDKYPDFHYAHTQAYTYETVERYYPEVFSELKEKIKNGQFEVVGAMYVEPDCNISAAESLIRQCLYGQTYFREKFGITVDTCWLPDVFGNSWILPQILKNSGVKYFVSNKMSTWNDTNRFPHNNFIWRGIDGTDIYACVPPTHFITWNEPSQIQENWDAFQDKDTGTETLSMFGYGDGGSGATEEMIELMHRFKKLPVMPQTSHVTAGEFLRNNFTPEHKFATWDGELYLEMHRGTFTTKSELKYRNRRLEYKFRDAEIISVLRFIKNGTYPAEKIRELYKKFLVNQFHDILPGSHITPVYRDAIADYNEIYSELDKIIGEGNGYFNTFNFERNDVCFIPDDNGIFMRHGEKGRFARLSFPALSKGDISAPGNDASWLKIDSLHIVTPYYEIEFNDDGSINSLYDKELLREWTDGCFNKLKLYADMPGNYDAWDILPDYTDREIALSVKSPFTFVKADGECAEFSVTLSTGKSEWTRLIRVFRTSRGIENENIVDWNEKHRLMKAEFNCNILTRELVCDTSAGYIKRDMTRNTSWQSARFECCHHKWFNLDENGAGIAVINEGKYGVGVSQKAVSLSLLRATIRPDPESDIGQHDFCYMILPHDGSFTEAKVNETAFCYNDAPCKADVTAAEKYPGLYMQSMKLSEDGKMIVVRLSEQNSKRGCIKLGRRVKLLNLLEDIVGETDCIEYKPFEIITIGIDV